MNRKILAVMIVAVGVTALSGYAFYAPASVKLSITDPPPQPYDPSITAIIITLTKVEIHAAHAGEQSGWHTLATGSTVDLWTVLSVPHALGTSALPKYAEIRS